ncbi:hypothetical protein VaNZ11_008072, partial [Volvox africanus]
CAVFSLFGVFCLHFILSSNFIHSAQSRGKVHIFKSHIDLPHYVTRSTSKSSLSPHLLSVGILAFNGQISTVRVSRALGSSFKADNKLQVLFQLYFTMMQHTFFCSYQCTRTSRLTSRNLIATGTSLPSVPGVQRHDTNLICLAVSKTGAHPGGDSTGKSAGSLAESLLRETMGAISALATTGSIGSSSVSRAAAVAPPPEDLRSATYAITATNTAIFFLSAMVPLLPASALLLNHRQPHLWQLLTSSFAHPSLESLMLCVFFTYIFGRVVERSHGSLATWVVYATCGAAAAALAWCLLPAKAALLSSAAPAAAWGLFLVGIGLPRLSKKPLEVACLLPFTFAATVSRYSPLSGLMVYEGMPQGQLIHVAGATMAAMVAVLVLGAVAVWRAEAQRKRQEAKRQEAAAREEDAINAVINAASQAAAQIGRKLL